MMSNNNSFGGKLRKVLASMCSLFVGASGVSRAERLGTNIPTNLKLGKDACLFGFGDIGWKLESRLENARAKKENSWLVRKNNVGGYDMKYQLIGKINEVDFWVGFHCDDVVCHFCIWVNNGNDVIADVVIPKGILFDVMRHFENNYFRNNYAGQHNGIGLSCTEGKLGDDDGVFLRFILWAFCGSAKAIDPKYSATANELRADILGCVVNVNDLAHAGDKFKVMGEEGHKYAVLKPGYLLENFNVRVCDAYAGLECNMMTDVDGMLRLIIQLNKEKKILENQKHIGKYLLGIFGGLVAGGALVEGTHRFFGAKRSRSSEVNKDKISSNKISSNKISSNKISSNKISSNKISSNGKNGQKAKNNLKK